MGGRQKERRWTYKYVGGRWCDGESGIIKKKKRKREKGNRKGFH